MKLLFLFLGFFSYSSYALEVVAKDSNTGSVDFYPEAFANALAIPVLGIVCGVASFLLIGLFFNFFRRILNYYKTR
jgi:hypothetical protein